MNNKKKKRNEEQKRTNWEFLILPTKIYPIMDIREKKKKLRSSFR